MESVAAGYRLTIYDYTNDVMVRDEIERILESVSPERRSELEGELSAAESSDWRISPDEFQALLERDWPDARVTRVSEGPMPLSLGSESGPGDLVKTIERAEACVESHQ